MYAYIYDVFLQKHAHEKELRDIENTLTDMGIFGTAHAISMITSIKDAVAREIRKGTKTIVAVGNDETLYQVIAAALGSGVVIAYIPIESEMMAQYLQIPLGVHACKVLSRRKVTAFDVGTANGEPFFSHAIVSASHAVVEADGFIIRSHAEGVLALYNAGNFAETVPHPTDGKLELVVASKERKKTFLFVNKTEHHVSIFPLTQCLIKGEADDTMELDGYKTIKLPVKIEVLPASLEVVVG